MAFTICLFLISSFLYSQGFFAHAQHDRTHNFSTSWPTTQVSVTASICQARTINYITHSLPQLCLTNTWVSTSFTQNDTLASATPAPSINNGTGYNGSTPTPVSQLTSDVDTRAESDSSTELPEGEPSTNTFMSFEDWKEMMLRRNGQDPQDLKSRKSNKNRAHERIPPDLGHFGLGEEEEISLDFDNYLQKPDQDSLTFETDTENNDVEERTHMDPDDSPSGRRSKDAGKTCKERFSYSSFDAGATVLKTGPGAKNAKAILVEHKDSYMLLECATQSKYVIVELSDDILIDTVVLANFEFFSSMIRHFRVSVSDRYPVKIDRWNTIGTFEARNSRDIQPFLVENPQLWAKFVRIEFLTHYGNEYYCPVSLLRIHGSRFLDSWKDTTLPEYGGEEDEEHLPHLPEINENPVAEGNQQASPELPGDLLESSNKILDAQESREGASQVAGTWPVQSASSGQDCRFCPSLLVPNSDTCPASFSIYPEIGCCRGCFIDASNTLVNAALASKGHRQDEQLTTPTPARHSSELDPSMESLVATASEASGLTSSSHSPSHTKIPLNNQTSTKETTNTSTSTTSSARPTVSTPSGSKQRASGAPGGSPPAPTVQEGFFNVITKRLHNVETNLTLSLQYLEDQSRHLQEAFHKAEQKQLLKVTNFLDHLNHTVFSELRGIRTQYDQIWQSTVIALETQREQSERDIIALGTRLNLLADEVVFQKRMAIVQAVLLLCCLFLVIFSRGVPIPYLAPLLEQNSSSGLYTASASVLRTKAISLGQDNVSEKNVASPALESLHTSATHIGPGRSVLSHTSIVETGESRSFQEGGLSPPTTPGPQNSDTDDLCSVTGLDVHDSAPHRVGGYQTPHSRKPLPALPEHPSPPS